MNLSFATLFGQLFTLFFLVLIVYLIALVPISLKKIVTELAAIKEELRKHNGRSND